MATQNLWQLGQLYTEKSEIMGLPEDIVFAEGVWQGFLMDAHRTRHIIQLILNQAQWRTRFDAEKDENWQQIYPYALFKYQDQYAEFKRGVSNTSDSRLNMKYTLAVGGHVFKTDWQKAGSLENFIQQIFHHDIQYQGNLTVKPIGIINDNSDDLGRYHIGVVFLLEGDNPNLVSNIHTELRLIKLADMTGEDVSFLERWSQMIYRQLRDAELAAQNASEGPQHLHVSHLK